MAKVVVGMTMSVDGFVLDRDGEFSRLYPTLGELRETGDAAAARCPGEPLFAAHRALPLAALGRFAAYLWGLIRYFSPVACLP